VRESLHDRAWLLEQVDTQPLLGGRIHWLGPRDDVPGLLKTADVLVLASLWEGMPNVVLEALACGLPVITTPNTGANGWDFFVDSIHVTTNLSPVPEPSTLSLLGLGASTARFVSTNLNCVLIRRSNGSLRVIHYSKPFGRKHQTRASSCSRLRTSSSTERR
jgi:hypothetical protein